MRFSLLFLLKESMTNYDDVTLVSSVDLTI